MSKPRAFEGILARVIGAYARTQFLPASGERIYIGDDGVVFACALGAVSVDEHPQATSNYGMDAPFGVHSECVGYGWDDAIDSNFHVEDFEDPRCAGCGRRSCPFYTAGAVAAVAMEVA